MATATKQLEDIFQEISQTFSGHSSITVTPLDGNPPEKYEITYQTSGVYRDDSGEIQEKDTHTITIGIPFGFPHFPPSCKPKSSIFHPDFDPAAICIGDFWEKDRSISDLIRHIGQMISGEVYSTSNTFNEEAAKWYKDNRSRLPFETTEFTSDDDSFSQQLVGDDVTVLLEDNEDDDNESILEEITLESTPDKNKDPGPESVVDFNTDEKDTGVDTLDESFLDTDFDYLGAAKDSSGSDELITPVLETDEAGSGIDIDRLKLMVKQKRFHELDKELASLSDDQLFEEFDTLVGQAAAALKEAREAYDKGTDFEHQGNPSKALDSFRQVDQIVSDYPGLKDDIKRTAQAKELFGDWVETPQEDEESTPALAEIEESTEEEFPALGSPELEKKKSGARTFFEGTARQSSRLIPFAGGIVVILVLAVAGVYYYLSSTQLAKAETKFDECQAVLKQNRFAEAERQCEAAIDQAKQIQVFKGGDRDRLITEIKKVLNSQVLIEGLAGNRLLDGKYLPKDVVKTIIAFKYFMAAGDTHFAKEDWQQAASSYKQALGLATQRKGVDRELVFAVTENMKIAKFKVLFRSGTKFIEREEWVLATQDLKKALNHVKTLNIENKVEIIDSITVKLAKISLATSKEEGDAAFAAGNWKKALDHYEDAITAVKKSHSPGDPTQEQLNQLMIKARLYNTIDSAKKAFTNAEWDEAISNYEQAIKILESNQEVLKQTNTEENRMRLSRIMLQASVIRDKQDAARQLKKNQYEPGIKKLQSIIDTITKSNFSREEEFLAVIKETKAAIKQAEKDILLADKITYLEENFIDIFTKHYTASSPEALTNPTVIFEKRLENDKLLFKLQCIEIGRGRPLRLVMKYTHDLKTGEWSFYGDTD